MLIAKLCILLLCLLPTVLTATDYCSKSLCDASRHIACNNRGRYSTICAPNAKLITITHEIRNHILHKHNEYRNKIAGGFHKFAPAARMASMVWNSELSKLAEFNVKQCLMIHDACHNTAKFRHSGQNLAVSSWKGMKMSIKAVTNDHIHMWFDEYKDCPMSTINSYSAPSNKKQIGHFTVMIQDKNTAVGCAILRQVKSNGFNEQLLACNYGYTNFVHKPVYETGKPASKCKTGVNENYPFLCSTKEKY